MTALDDEIARREAPDYQRFGPATDAQAPTERAGQSAVRAQQHGELVGLKLARHLLASTPAAGGSETLRPFAEDIDQVIAEAGITGKFIAGTLLDVEWVPRRAVEEAVALIPGLPCPMRSSVSDAPCALLWGHPMDRASRFHRFDWNGPERRHRP